MEMYLFKLLHHQYAIFRKIRLSDGLQGKLPEGWKVSWKILID
jgi:hypothetical protein